MAGRFVASAVSHVSLPITEVPEVAFAGRSNVGKSSLLGAVLGAPKLVRTSRTPGRTQAINLFLFDDALALVDLPGYGYAKLSKAQRTALDQMIRGYLTARAALAGVVLLVDARREEVSELDRAMVRFVLAAERALLVAITKSDLVPKTRRGHVARTIEQTLALPRGTALLCSAKTGEGLRELRASLHEIGLQAPHGADVP